MDRISYCVPSTSSQATIKALRNMFATHGIPETIVSDNGSGFTSCEFGDFTEEERHSDTSRQLLTILQVMA